MDHGFVILIGVAFLVLVPAVNAYLRAKRRRELREEAPRLGLRFLEDGEPRDLELSPHPLFSRGRDHRLENMMEGPMSGFGLRIFDYAFVTGSGKSRKTHRQTVAAIELPGAPLPEFELFPERLCHWFAELVGYRDIDFDGHDAFNRAYRLLGKDEAAVRGRFGTELLNRLADRPGWTIEGAGRTVLLYRPQTLVAPAELARFVDDARELALGFGSR